VRFNPASHSFVDSCRGTVLQLAPFRNSST